jgi:oligopeptide transport system substrate-binding protein
MTMVGWLPNVPTPDGFLSGQLRSEARDNHAHFKDAGFDRLLDRARRTRNDRQRLGYYRRAERRALERMPLIPILFFRNRAVIADRVQDLLLDGAGLFEGERVWLAA